MIICPWCGANYVSFQTNCTNCGGPLQMDRENIAAPALDREIMAPPPAPRPISSQYAWKVLLTDLWGIVALVLGLLGIVFTLVGTGLALAIVTAFVGIPFLLIGLVFLAVAVALGTWRYGHARQVVNVLRTGESTQGQITDVQQDFSVRVNRQHPWVIRYQFQVKGQNYEGSVRTLNQVGTRLQAGEMAWILYLPDAPQWNAIYPHP